MSDITACALSCKQDKTTATMTSHKVFQKFTEFFLQGGGFWGQIPLPVPTDTWIGQ